MPVLLAVAALLVLGAGLIFMSGSAEEPPAPRVIETRGLIRAEIPPPSKGAPEVPEVPTPSAVPVVASPATPVEPAPAVPEEVPPSDGAAAQEGAVPEGEAPAEEPPVTADEPAADAVVEAELAPPVEEPVEAAQVVVPMLRAGFWKGTANGRPLELRVGVVDGESIRGELTFYLGPTARTVPAEGTVDNTTGRLTIRGGDYVLSGAVDGASMSGTYSTGKKQLPWALDWASN